MKKIIFLVFIGLFSFSLVSDSLNLVEIQKKEKKRRKKIKKSKYVLTNDLLVKYSLKKSKSFVESDGVVSQGTSKTPKKKKSPDDKSSEEYWRARLKSLNSSIDALKKMVNETQSRLNRESTNFLVASTASLQQQLQNNINTLKNKLEKYRADLKQREMDLEAFYTEARKSGALPGWLR